MARDAKVFRSPEPRYSGAAYPWRSKFGQFRLKDDSAVWQRLEKRIAYLDLKNQHAGPPISAALLISIFEATWVGRCLLCCAPTA